MGCTMGRILFDSKQWRALVLAGFEFMRRCSLKKSIFAVRNSQEQCPVCSKGIPFPLPRECTSQNRGKPPLYKLKKQKNYDQQNEHRTTQ